MEMRDNVDPTASRVWLRWLIVLFILALILAWLLLGWSTPLGYAGHRGVTLWSMWA